MIDNQVNHLSSPKIRLLISLIVVIGLSLAGWLVYTLLSQPTPDSSITLTEPVAASRSYIGKVVAAQIMEPVVENGQVMLKLADVDQANIVRFELANDLGDPVPMMAYITSSGRLYAGDALCACGCSEFVLAGKALVCNNCRSTYDIENQNYLSGAAICEQYPPTSMQPVVQDGWIMISQSKVLNWRNSQQQ